MSEYGLFIDEERCWGCKTCEVACKQECGTSDGLRLIAVEADGPTLIDGCWHLVYRVNLCRHCNDAPCADACPEDAFTVRSDGIVVLDYDVCTGCGACVEACPYDAISLDPEKGIAQKCNLCHHRVDQGLIPACADNVCLAHCIHFGRPDQLKTFAVVHRKDAASGPPMRK